MAFFETDASRKFIGVKVERFEIDPDRNSITVYGTKRRIMWPFPLEKFVFLIQLSGDTASWIEDIVDPEDLIGSTVRKLEFIYGRNKPMNGNYNSHHCPHYHDGNVKHYGLQIRTTRGRCTIDFRSLGYSESQITIQEIVVDK